MDLIAEKELLKQLGNLSRQSIWRYRALGLKYYKLGAKTYYKPSEVMQFIEQYSSHYSSKKATPNDRNQ